MNLDELQSVRDRERQSDSLQQLRESFYEDAGTLVAELREEREAAAARADDPFDAPEVNRLTDDIKTAEQTVEAIYERRVGKLVKMASFAAADMPTEDEGLTAEERTLFENLVQSIEQNREQVFAALDNTDAPTPDTGGAADPAQPTADESQGVGAADLMGSDASPDGTTASPDDGSGSTDSTREHPPETPPPDTDRDTPAETGTDTAPSPGTEPVGADDVPTPGSGPDDAAGPESQPPADRPETSTDETEAAPAPPAGGVPEETDGEATARRSDGGETRVDRSTVRITEDVGEIFCVDERQYDLSSEDVVTLPTANAAPLVERDAAERLD
ncbi:hypothetical protein [Halorientalis litorea]|uniref:hypothetical protein n=1 Tax=Halorientalis litorea TaxID=2931977 RepID=UPI001FF46C9E|nr:hypothetical protein [Halorientalis litorea]